MTELARIVHGASLCYHGNIELKQNGGQDKYSYFYNIFGSRASRIAYYRLSYTNLWHSRRKLTFQRKNTKMSYLYHVVALTLLYFLVLVALQSVLLFPSYKGKRVNH